MNFQELKNFLALAELLHFGKASQACHLSPSALTRSIQRLEETLGHTLFIRDNRTVTLTPTGEKFRHYAISTLRDWETFCEEIQGSGHVSGELSIYASVTAVYSILPKLLEKYRATFPEVQLELRTGAAEESVQQVLDGEIDLSIAALPDQKNAKLEFMPLTRTNLVFISPKQSPHPLDITQSPLVLPRSGLSRKRIDQWFKKKNLTPHISTEVSGNEGILAMVRLGCGIGIIPELVLERSPFRHDVTIIPDAPELTPYIVGLCTTRRNLQRSAIAALWELAEEPSE